MEVYDAIEKRRSVRKFRPIPVPEGLLKRILTAGTQAPNAFNREPWEFIIVKDMELKEKIAQMRIKIPPQMTAIDTAPLLIVVCYDNELGEDALASAYACIENILLAATAEELGAVTLTFHSKKIKELLEIPEGFDVAAVMPLGYPDDDTKKPGRIPVDEKIHSNRF